MSITDYRASKAKDEADRYNLPAAKVGRMLKLLIGAIERTSKEGGYQTTLEIEPTVEPETLINALKELQKLGYGVAPAIKTNTQWKGFKRVTTRIRTVSLVWREIGK